MVKRQVPSRISDRLEAVLLEALLVFMYSKILGTGSYLPSQVRTNADLENGRY